MSQKSKSPTLTVLTKKVLRNWALPAVDEKADKNSRGKLLIVAGSPEIPGAIILCATCAMRAGAGKIQILSPKSVATDIALKLPETLVHGCPSTGAGAFKNTMSPKLIALVERTDAILVGPGMAAGNETSAFVKKLFTKTKDQTVVFDAEALIPFSKKMDWAKRKGAKIILTPHAGEMATLTGKTKKEIENNAPAIAQEFSKKSGAVIVLKGAKTYIAGPQGELYLNTRGNKGLAAAGSGDSLAGIIAGLAARGAPPLQAAAWGVHLHALAGEKLAKKHGELGYLMRELSECIPKIMNSIK